MTTRFSSKSEARRRWIPACERVKEMAFRGDCGVAACYIAELGRMASETPPRKGLGVGTLSAAAPRRVARAALVGAGSGDAGGLEAQPLNRHEIMGERMPQGDGLGLDQAAHRHEAETM